MGDLIQKVDGTHGVVQFNTTEYRTQTMYNLTVANAHTFYVGDGDWLVHNCDDEIIDLYRAVSPDELNDIKKTGQFNLPPYGETKYFSTSLDGAKQYGKMAETGFGLTKHLYVKTSIPSKHVTPDMLVEVDRGISSVVVPVNCVIYLSQGKSDNYASKLYNKSKNSFISRDRCGEAKEWDT